MVTSVTALSIMLVFLCIFNGVVESKLLSNDPPNGDKVENGNYPLEQKLDALTQVVELLLVESKAKDLKILNLEKRVSELEKRPADPNDIQGTRITHQHTVQSVDDEKENTSNNFNKSKTVPKYSHPKSAATKYKHTILKRVPETTPTPKPKIAFHTHLTSNEAAVINTIIAFQQTSLDTANAYNTADGIYTVPENGIYVFTWTITGGRHSIATTELMIDSNVAGQTIADSQEVSDLHTSTGFCIASVTKGQHVYVKFSAPYHLGGIESSVGRSTFSGWKLD